MHVCFGWAKRYVPTDGLGEGVRLPLIRTPLRGNRVGFGSRRKDYAATEPFTDHHQADTATSLQHRFFNYNTVNISAFSMYITYIANYYKNCGQLRR